MALGVSGVVFACGGSSSGGSGAAATDSQSFITEFCGLYAPCCGKVNKPTDGASCRALYSGLLGSQQYDSEKGNACLTELRAQSNAPDYCDNPGAKAPSCNGAFKESGGGTKQPGEDCSKDGDCASSAEGSVNCASSYGSGSAVTKSCQVEIDGKEGDTPCISTRDGNTTYGTGSFSSGDAGPTRPAARGYVCDVAKQVYCSSKTQACAAIHEVGGACETTAFSCVKTAFCDSSLKQCVARHAVGEDCSTFSPSCVDKAICDAQTKKCIAGLVDGTPCTTGTACASSVCVNGKCDTASSSGGLSTQLLCGGN